MPTLNRSLRFSPLVTLCSDVAEFVQSIVLQIGETVSSPWRRSAQAPKRSCHPRRWTDLIYRTALMGVVSSTLLLSIRISVQAEPLVLKQGEFNPLPNLQTRSQPPVQPLEMMYLGMLEDRFLNYATENNWLTVSVVNDRTHPQQWSRWHLQPGGEAVYPPVWNQIEPVYARGFEVKAYFGDGRLVGMNVIDDPREPGFDLQDLRHLVQAWFPDNRILLRYQILPDDTTQQIIAAYWGNIPAAFISDLTRTNVPYCQAFLSPSASLPLPLASVDLPSQCFPLMDDDQQNRFNPRLLQSTDDLLDQIYSRSASDVPDTIQTKPETQSDPDQTQVVQSGSL